MTVAPELLFALVAVLFAIALAAVLVAFAAGAWVAFRCTKGLTPIPSFGRAAPAAVKADKSNDKPRRELPRVEI